MKNPLNRAVPALACLLLGAGLTGCGYTTRSMLSNEYHKIYIAPFTNQIDITRETDTGDKYKIYRPHLETDVTRAVSNKFLFDGNLRPVSEESADLVLRGELIEFRRDPLRYDTNDDVEEYRVNVRVNLALSKNHTNTTVWEENGFTGDATYFTAGHPGATSEDVAANTAIDDLARRVVERTVEEW